MELINKIEIGQRYLLDQMLGEGAHGEVYRAYDSVRKAHVALKIFKDNALDAQLAEAARHFQVSDSQAVLPLLEVHPDYPEGPVTVMPLMDQTLAGKSPIFVSEALYHVRRLLTALQFCHGNDVVHGDIKPSNLFFKGPRDLQLGDFGVQDFLPNGDRGHTLEYAAPEVLRGNPRSSMTDLWAVAVTLYQLLCGQLPFGSRPDDLEVGVRDRILSGSYAAPDQLRPYLPFAFRRFFEGCFQSDPESRPFHTAEAMRNGLSQLVAKVEWLKIKKQGYAICYEGHELTSDMERTGTCYEAKIRERPRKGDFEATISKAALGGAPRRMAGIPPFFGSRARAKEKLRVWMRRLTDRGGLT